MPQIDDGIAATVAALGDAGKSRRSFAFRALATPLPPTSTPPSAA